MEKNDHEEIGFEYNQITDNIFIGTNFCCQSHFDSNLIKMGITTLLSVEGEEVDAPFGVEFFSWIPVTDHQAPTQSQFKLGVSVLDMLVTMEKKVYVHCMHGHGRAPTIVAAYFVSQGASVEEAIARIKEKRSVIHLDDSQIKALEDFAKNL